MAGGGLYVASSKREYSYSSRPTAFVVLTCIIAATGGLIFGYDLGVSGGVTSMDDFLLKFFPTVYDKKHSAKTDNYCKFDNELLTAFTSSLYLAGLFTAAFASHFSFRYGRRACMRTGAVCFVTGSALNAAATNLAMLILGRVMLGIGLGFTNQSMPLYLSEIAPPQWRGGLNSLAQVTLCIGALSAFLVNYATARIIPWGWRISLGFTMVPSIIILLGSFCLPDSPSSLIERGCLQESRAILQKMRGRTSDVQEEFEDLLQASEVCKAVRHPWREILKRRYRPVLVMAVAIPFLTQVTGINIVTFYAPVLFETLGLGENASLYAAVILGGAGLGAAVVAVVVVDKVGRRALLLSGSLQMLATLVIIGVMLRLKLGAHNVMSKGDAAVLVTTVCIYVAAFGWSWGPVGALVPSEVFPLEVRSAGQSVNTCITLGLIAVEAQVFLAMLCHMRAALFFMFAFWVLAGMAFVWWLLPETKRVPLETMAHLWHQHPLWSTFTPST